MEQKKSVSIKKKHNLNTLCSLVNTIIMPNFIISRNCVNGIEVLSEIFLRLY